MILVKTRVGKSDIEGLGMIADEFIPKGTKIWEFVEGLDISLDQTAYSKLPKLAQDYFKHYGYLDRETKSWMLGFDNDRFWNHSDLPNTVDKGDIVIAKSDIQPGQEITCDYRTFADDWQAKLPHLPK